MIFKQIYLINRWNLCESYHSGKSGRGSNVNEGRYSILSQILRPGVSSSDPDYYHTKDTHFCVGGGP